MFPSGLKTHHPCYFDFLATKQTKDVLTSIHFELQPKRSMQLIFMSQEKEVSY